jgi:hypothetical protein
VTEHAFQVTRSALQVTPQKLRVIQKAFPVAADALSPSVCLLRASLTEDEVVGLRLWAVSAPFHAGPVPLLV